MADNPPKTVYPNLRDSPNQRRFLACLAICGSLTTAARWAKISRQAHYNWLRDDPEYSPKYEDALRKSADTLADEAVRRGREGIRKPIWYKGKVCGYETEYSDQLLLRMLEARRPDLFSTRVKNEHSGPDGVPLEPIRVIVEYEDHPPEAPKAP